MSLYLAVPLQINSLDHAVPLEKSVFLSSSKHVRSMEEDNNLRRTVLGLAPFKQDHNKK